MQNLSIGKTLSALLKEGASFTMEQCKMIFNQIFVAVDYLHSRKIYHKGLAGSNIFIDEENHVMINDYGLVPILDEDRFVLNPDRQPIYTAPEIFFGEESTTEPDVWSIAAIFYELLTGKQAFIDENSHDIQLKIMEGAYNKGLMETKGDLGQLVKKMLHVKRATRITLGAARGIFIIYIYIYNIYIYI